MADPFVAEIRIFPFNFAPEGWAWCDGQILEIAQNTALFSLLGTTYGGNGTTQYALPNLQGRAPMAPGQGPGLSLYDLGQQGGAETVTLPESQMPAHTHTLQAQTGVASSNVATNKSLARAAPGVLAYVAGNGAPTVPKHGAALATHGASQPHNNMQPYLTFNFNIALLGVFPPRG